jgi:hypothetical protein
VVEQLKTQIAAVAHFVVITAFDATTTASEKTHTRDLLAELATPPTTLSLFDAASIDTLSLATLTSVIAEPVPTEIGADGVDISLTSSLSPAELLLPPALRPFVATTHYSPVVGGRSNRNRLFSLLTIITRISITLASFNH